ncbi:MAG: hypothetical protein K2Y71_30065 [Xanthobacteraceae bacterium]|nr:hypothetical protein [Xanthobacteraceae bacterium]MBX9826918.1 hypothetical protein [Xanthobacteraceae bacterium]
MNATTGRTCLILGLLCLSLAAALSVDLKVRHDGETVQARMASTMLLQGSTEDEASAAPDVDENDKLASCSGRHCQLSKHELALVLAEDRQIESKQFVALDDETRPKPKE